MCIRDRATAVRRWLAYIVLVTAVSLAPRRAAAEKVLVNLDGWQVYTDGRAGGFGSYSYGDGYPQPVQELVVTTDPTTMTTTKTLYPISQPLGGGFASVAETQQLDPEVANYNTQGHINMLRFRSGMISNVFGF